MTSIITMVLILSYTIITGYLGQVSLAQIAFAGASGFLLSKATVNWGLGLPVESARLGLVRHRSSGSSSAWRPSVSVACSWPSSPWRRRSPSRPSCSITPTSRPPRGTWSGRPRLFGVNLAIEGTHNVARLQFGVMVLVILLLCVAGLLRWARGRTGRAWLAVRSNERAAASSGINLATTKISGFALSAFLAGLAGALVGYSQGQLSTGSFEVDTGILLFATAFLGGITSVGGAAVAGAIAPLGFVYVLLNDHINFGKWYSLIAGIGLIFTVMNNPDGIAGKTGEQMEALWARIGPKPRRQEFEPGPGGAGGGDRRAGGPDRRERSLSDQPGCHPVRPEHDSVRFGGMTANSDVTMKAEPGQITALIGPNGAGKTTLINAVTGFVRASGTIHIGDQSLTGLPPHTRRRMGLARTWQAGELFDALSILDNVRVAEEHSGAIYLAKDLLPYSTESRGPGSRGAQPGRAGRPPRPLPERAVPRPAAAGRRGPRPRGRAVGAAARRAGGRPGFR